MLAEGAAGAVAGQVAGQVGKDAILQSVFNPAVIQGTDSIMANALAPSLAEIGTQELGMDAILQASLGNQALGQTAQTALQQGAGNVFGANTNLAQQDPGFLSNMSNLFGDKGFTSAVDMGTKAFGAYDTYQARKDAQDFQEEQLKMSQSAYDRNVEADEKRQSLNF